MTARRRKHQQAVRGSRKQFRSAAAAALRNTALIALDLRIPVPSFTPFLGALDSGHGSVPIPRLVLPLSWQTRAEGATRHGQDSSVTSSDSSDLALLERMRGGDESALATLYDRWCDRVNSLAVHLLRDVRDAEDIVEETFWQAWRSAARYDAARGTVGAWLLTITRSRALDRIRARRRRPEDTTLDDVPEAAAPGENAADAVVADETGRLVRAAMAELPAEQRQALELAYFSGLSQSEIANKTGQPLGTIKTRMRLAMNKLRERLASLKEARA